MHVNATYDLTDKPIISVTIVPAMQYNAPILMISTQNGPLSIEADNDQLALISETIQRHLQAIRYQETPDQQRGLNHEYEAEATV